MTSIPNKTSLEFIDGLLEVLQKFEETLVAAKSFVLTSNGTADAGGDPFEVISLEVDEAAKPSLLETHEVPSEDELAARFLGAVETLTLEIGRVQKEDSPSVEKWPSKDSAEISDQVSGVLDDIHEMSDERAEATKGVVKKRRAKSLRRASVTPELREKILDALLSRQPRPRMVDVANEFEVSQSTVSRLLGIHREEVGTEAHEADQKEHLEQTHKPKVVGLSRTGPNDDQHGPISGQLELPIISEGRKPGLED